MNVGYGLNRTKFVDSREDLAVVVSRSPLKERKERWDGGTVGGVMCGVRDY